MEEESGAQPTVLMSPELRNWPLLIEWIQRGEDGW